MPDALLRLRGRPKSLRVDNGPEFAGRMLDQWADLNGVAIEWVALRLPLPLPLPLPTEEADRQRQQSSRLTTVYGRSA